MKKKLSLLFLFVFPITVGLLSYRVTYALFSSTAASTNNTFSAAEVFPTPTQTPTPTPTSTPTPTPTPPPVTVHGQVTNPGPVSGANITISCNHGGPVLKNTTTDVSGNYSVTYSNQGALNLCQPPDAVTAFAISGLTTGNATGTVPPTNDLTLNILIFVPTPTPTPIVTPTPLPPPTITTVTRNSRSCLFSLCTVGLTVDGTNFATGIAAEAKTGSATPIPSVPAIVDSTRLTVTFIGLSQNKVYDLRLYFPLDSSRQVTKVAAFTTNTSP